MPLIILHISLSPKFLEILCHLFLLQLLWTYIYKLSYSDRFLVFSVAQAKSLILSFFFNKFCLCHQAVPNDKILKTQPQSRQFSLLPPLFHLLRENICNMLTLLFYFSFLIDIYPEAKRKPWCVILAKLSHVQNFPVILLWIFLWLSCKYQQLVVVNSSNPSIWEWLVQPHWPFLKQQITQCELSHSISSCLYWAPSSPQGRFA